MQTITSVAQGNWNSQSVWDLGRIPQAGDDVIIKHNITYNVNDTTTLINTITIQSGGVLQHSNSMQTGLYVYKITIDGGQYIMTPNSYLKIARNNTIAYGSTGRIWMTTTDNSKFITKGDIYEQYTTLTQQQNVGDQFLQVQDSSKFSVGDIVLVYKDTNSIYDEEDEAFFVNYVESGKIYMRKFVGPSVTVTQNQSTGQTTLYVDNQRKFLDVKYAIIQNSNKVITINNIDVVNNKLTVNQLPWQISAGTILYETGFDKVHSNGSEVYRLQATLTSQVSAGYTTITVSGVGGFQVGDQIWIEDTNWNGETRYEGWFATISQINSNVLTLTNIYRQNFKTITNLASIDRNIEAGQLVVKVTRNCVIEAEFGDGGPYIYIDYTTNSNRVVDIQDTLFKYFGGSDNYYYRGVRIRGYFNGTNGYCRFQRNQYIDMNKKQDWDGVNFWSQYYGIRPIRANFMWGSQFNGTDGDNQSGAWYGNISQFTNHSGERRQYDNDAFKDQYNIITQSGYGLYLIGHYSERIPNSRTDYWTNKVEYNIIRFTRDPLYIDVNERGTNFQIRRLLLYKSYYDPVYILAHNDKVFILDSIVEATVAPNPSRSSGYSTTGDRTYSNVGAVFINQDFSGKSVWYKGKSTYYLESLNGRPVIRFVKRDTQYWDGIIEQIYLSKDAKLVFEGDFKVANDYNGSTPKIVVFSPFFDNPQETQIQNFTNGQWIHYRYELTAQHSGFYFVSLLFNHDNKNVWLTIPVIKVYGYDQTHYFLDKYSVGQVSYISTFDRTVNYNYQYGLRINSGRLGG